MKKINLIFLKILTFITLLILYISLMLIGDIIFVGSKYEIVKYIPALVVLLYDIFTDKVQNNIERAIIWVIQKVESD